MNHPRPRETGERYLFEKMKGLTLDALQLSLDLLNLIDQVRLALAHASQSAALLRCEVRVLELS